MRRFLFNLTAIYPVRFIKPDGNPYIERYYMGRVFGITIYLHRYVGADGRDSGVHDHPWSWAVGIPLAGGYIERVMVRLCSLHGVITRTRFVGRFSFNWLSSNKAHQITAIIPETWTLFLHGGRCKGWGFYEDHGSAIVYTNSIGDKTDKGAWWRDAPVGERSGREPFPVSL